ncbi:MAG: hypothetical protein ACREBS_08700, partial [Nitrososphaerales archaeon]
METLGAQSTTVFHGTDATTRIRLETLSRAKRWINICDDSEGVTALVNNRQITKCLTEASTKPNPPKIRLITEITGGNLSACKEIMQYAELRHFRGLRGNFVVTENEYYAFAELKNSPAPNETIHSDVKTIVDQNLFVFETFWNNAVPATNRIAEIERGISSIETRVVKDANEILKLDMELIKRATSDCSSSVDRSFIFIASLDSNADRDKPIYECAIQMLRENPNLGIRLIIDIRRDNLDLVRQLLGAGLRVRHIENNRISFLVSNREYIAGTDSKAFHSDARRKNAQAALEAVWSNNPEIVSQAALIFRMLWEGAIPAEAKIAQIEEGFELGETRIVKNLRESATLAKSAIESCAKEVLIILASITTIERNSAMYADLMKRSM